MDVNSITLNNIDFWKAFQKILHKVLRKNVKTKAIVQN